MVLESIAKAVSAVLGVDAADVTEESRFVDDLGADSLDLFEIIVNLEEEFNIEIPTEEAEKIKTVGDAVEKISSIINE